MAVKHVCDYCPADHQSDAVTIRRHGVTTGEGRRALISVKIETDEGEKEPVVAELCLHHYLTTLMDALDPNWRSRVEGYAREAFNDHLLQPVPGEKAH